MSSEPESLVFSGNWRDAIPRALIFDPILDAVSVRVYMFLFTQASPGANMPFPSYEQIGRRLYISKPTVVRAIHLLRATRWISQAGELRGEDGRFLNNTYLLHDEPLPLSEAARLDGSYLAYLEGLESHAHPRVRMAASAILTTICNRFERWASDPLDDQVQIEERLRQRWSGDGFGFSAADHGSLSGFLETIGLEDDEDEDGVQNFNPVTARVKKTNPDEEGRVNIFNQDGLSLRNQYFANQVKNLNSAPSSSKRLETTTTKQTNRAREGEPPQLVFSRHLSSDERRLAGLRIKDFPQETQQDLLDELAGQIEAKAQTPRPIRNVIQYLSWMCNQLREGGSPFSSAGIKYRRCRETEEVRANRAKAPKPKGIPQNQQVQFAAMKRSLGRPFAPPPAGTPGHSGRGDRDAVPAPKLSLE